VQSDGKVLVGASVAGNPVLVRLEKDGTQDATFKAVPTGDPVQSVLVQPDGKILTRAVGPDGSTNIVRLNADSSFDLTFSDGGSGGAAVCLGLQPDGRVLIGGEDFSLPGSKSIRRLNRNGSLDPSFDTGDGAQGAVQFLAVRSDGRIMVLGGFDSFDGVPRNGLSRLHGDPVLSAPLSYASPVTQTVALGADVTIMADVIGTAPLFYQWEFQGAALPNATNSVLTLTNVALSDSGEYTAVVYNQFGGNLSSHSTVEVLPEVVNTLPVSAVLDQSAILLSSVTPGARGTKVWFEWGATTNYGFATAAVDLNGGFGSVSVSNLLGGLSPSTLYHYRPVASNMVGTVAGSDASFVTKAMMLVQANAPAIPGPFALSLSADGGRITALASPGENGGTGNPIPVYTSTNSGTAWAHVAKSIPGWVIGWNAVASSADGLKLVVAGDWPGALLTSTNAGATWRISNPPGNVGWTSVSSSADGRTLIAAATGNSAQPYGIYLSTNSGAVWTRLTVARTADAPPSAVASSADGSWLLAAESLPEGRMYASSDAGKSWSVLTNAPAQSWTGIACSTDGTKLLASAYSGGVGGGIFISKDSGKSWVSAGLPNFNYPRVSMAADGSTMVVAADSVEPRGGPPAFSPIYTSSDFGISWTEHLPTNRWHAVACSADGSRIVAAPASGGIYIMQTSPAPSLKMTRSGNQATLSWLFPSATFDLERNPGLATGGWSSLSQLPVLNLTNLSFEVALPIPSTGTTFYRLKH
jgi:uncharacterized delta-60 repeat protein